MQEPETLDQYPARTVLIANLLTLGMYITGVVLLSFLGILWVAGYLVLIIWLELRLVAGHCRDCYYFGRTCAFGRGRISALCFPSGNPEKFCSMTITWRDLIPDLLVMLIPVLAGLFLFITGTGILILIPVALLLILGFAGNAYVRGQLACRYCRQRILGCPAEALFRQGK